MFNKIRRLYILIALSLIVSFMTPVSVMASNYVPITEESPYLFRFDYIYDSTDSAIKLKVTSDKSVPEWGDTDTHIYGKSDTPFTLTHPYNEVMGQYSLFEAVLSMTNDKGINLNPYEVISRINNIGYTDNGYGIYKSGDAYLTYLSFDTIEKNGKGSTRTGSDYDITDREPYTHTVTFSSALPDTKYLPASFTKVEGRASYIPAREPYKEGYHFSYYESAAGDGSVLGDFLPNDAYTHDQNGGSTNLHAHFVSYIHYDNNSSLGTMRGCLIARTDDSIDTLLDGMTKTVTHKPAVYLIKDGQYIDVSKSVIFIGYNDRKDGTGAWYGVNATLDADSNTILNESTGVFDVSGSDKTLYAQYRLKYSLFYDGNDQTEGDDFTDLVEDMMPIASSVNTYAFKESPFKRQETETRYDKNMQEDIDYVVRYSYQGYSLNKDAYFRDKYIYVCPNKRRPEGCIMTISPSALLSECVAFNPSDNIAINDGYMTISIFAVWDRYPEVWGYDLSYTKELLEGMDEGDIYDMFLSDCDATSFDKEDSIFAKGYGLKEVPDISFVYFSKDDFLQDSDFGSTTLDLSVADMAGNTSTYRIHVYVASDSMNTSKGDNTTQALLYTRFLDEGNLKKSYDNYDTPDEALKDLEGLKEGSSNGSLMPYSKWLKDGTDNALLRTVMDEMDSTDHTGYASSITLDFDSIMNVRERAKDTTQYVHHDKPLGQYLFSGDKDTTVELKDTVNNDTEGYKKMEEINDKKKGDSLYVR